MKKDWNFLIEDLESTSANSVCLEVLVHDLNKIKRFIQKNTKNNIRDIKVSVGERYSFEKWEKCLTVEVGRFESLKEFNARMKEKRTRDKKIEEENASREKRELKRLKEKYGGEK